MKRWSFLWVIVLLSVGTIVLFPLYTVYYERPSFTAVLRENAADEAKRFAAHLSTAIINDEELLSGDTLPPSLLSQIKNLETDPHFQKVKIYTLSGEVLYSTNPKDIGKVNNEPYFREIANRGTSRAQEVPQHTLSLEKQLMPTDVVETYWPITVQGKRIGVFEIYYDISAERAKLHGLVNSSSAILSMMVIALLGAVLLATSKAAKNILAREKAEKDRESLIQELQRALSEIKQLSGLLPICCSCKKIRDDKGYWNQIEKYVSEHSEARFTHGICPECARRLYPEAFEKKK